MIIPVNNKWRIASASTCWEVQKYKGIKKDGSENWRPLYHCVDFKAALVSLAEVQIRGIEDSATTDEIKATLRIIRDECVTASEVFRELRA